MKIWVLFSIANEYDQPENNLLAWWFNKPTIEMIGDVLEIKFDIKKGNKDLGKIWKGEEIQLTTDYGLYRLEEIEEGKYIREKQETQ